MSRVSPADPPLLQAEHLERRFGTARVLRGISLAVYPGECHLILGPNGAGKTTLLRVLAGLMRPTAGRVVLEGGRRQVGLVSHQSQLYGDLTALENLVFAARLYALTDPLPAARDGLAAVGLSDRSNEPVRRLSRGMVQRVAIARALLHRPRILLLDEPFTGLDVEASGRTLEVLERERGAGRGLLVVSHEPQPAWSLATHAHLLVRGAWAFSGPRDTSLERFQDRYREALRG